MIYISICEALLYYVCLIMISRHILGCKPRYLALYLSFLAFVPIICFAICGNENMLNISNATFFFLQFALIKIIFKTIRISHIIFSYILIYCVNVLSITIISTFVPAYPLQTELIINTLTAILYIIAILTRIRIRLQQFFEWTPTYVLAIVSLLLISASFLSLFIFGADSTPYQSTWSSLTYIILVVLLGSISVILPLFILSGIANNRLKHLAANYEQQILAQAEHYKSLAAANFETRRFKHDFKNISIGIEKMLADGNYEQAIDYLRSYNRDLNTPGIFCSAFDTGNGIADALLADKQERASACNTIIVFHGALPVNFLSPTDLCVVLGNSLDNAIEACQKLSPEQVKTISLDCTCNSGFLFLTISNPVDHKVAIRDNYVATTKENKTLHGFGLYSLHSVVKKYNGDIRLTSTDTSFTINIDLCMVSSQKSENSLPL